MIVGRGGSAAFGLGLRPPKPRLVTSEPIVAEVCYLDGKRVSTTVTVDPVTLEPTIDMKGLRKCQFQVHYWSHDAKTGRPGVRLVEVVAAEPRRRP